MKVRVKYSKTIETAAYRTFGKLRYKWFDWTDSKRAANSTASRLRKAGHLVRIVTVATGYSIYTHAHDHKKGLI